MRYPLALITGGLISYVFNLVVLRPIYLHDITEMGLTDRYFTLGKIPTLVYKFLNRP